MVGRTWLVSLSDESCSSRLEEAVVGRLGVVVGGKPEVFPVCHVYVDGCVVFATNEGTKMHSALEWPWVAFEVDGIEPDRSSAWSVMVCGQAVEVTDPDDIARVAALQKFTFRVDGSVRWIRVVPTTVTGRQIAVG
jgi:uncharacterized protein